MSEMDKLLLAIAALGGIALLYLARSRHLGPPTVWVVGTLYFAFWTNLALWRGDHWDFESSALMFACSVFGGGLIAFSGWLPGWRSRRAEEKRRRHELTYPFQPRRRSD